MKEAELDPNWNYTHFKFDATQISKEIFLGINRHPPTKEQYDLGKKTISILQDFGFNRNTYGNFIMNIHNLKKFVQNITPLDNSFHYVEVERKMQSYIDVHTHLLWIRKLSQHLSSQQKKYFRKIGNCIIKGKQGDVWGATARQLPQFIWDKIALIGITKSNVRHYTKNTKAADLESILDILFHKTQLLQTEIKQQLVQYMKFLQSGTQQQVEEEALRLEASVCGETEMQPWKKTKPNIMKFKRTRNRLKTQWNKNIKTRIYKNKKLDQSVVTAQSTEALMITKRVLEDEWGMWQPPWEDYEDLMIPPITVVPEWGVLPKGMWICDFSEDTITIFQEPKTPTVPEKPSVVAKGREWVIVRDILEIV